MRLKVGIVDLDKIYLDRLSRNIQIKYPGEIELHTYSSVEEAYKGLDNIYFDVLLTAENLDFNDERIPKGVARIILTEKNDAYEIDGVLAMPKYRQKITAIYNEILAAYASVAEQGNERIRKQNSRIIMFTSAQGGSGTSTVAAAYALVQANKGKRVLYLPLDPFDDVSLFFAGEGRRSFTDVINAIKKNNKMAPALQSSVKKDESGVEFFDTCKNAYDMIELHENELNSLLDALQEQAYDEIVISYSAEFDNRQLKIISDYCDQIIYVCDGSKIGNLKFVRYCEAIGVVEQKKQIHILNRMKLLYNRFSSTSGEQLEETPVPVIGGINRIMLDNPKLLIAEIAKASTVEW